MKRLIGKLKAEDGVTLVELLAAITILSIIVTAFLAFFVQAADTNMRTDEVNEATFIAQEEMEEVIHLWKTKDEGFVSRSSKVNGFNVGTVVETGQIKRADPADASESIVIEMYRVIVTVKEGEAVRAQMENWLPIEESTTEDNT